MVCFRGALFSVEHPSPCTVCCFSLSRYNMYLWCGDVCCMLAGFHAWVIMLGVFYAKCVQVSAYQTRIFSKLILWVGVVMRHC